MIDPKGGSSAIAVFLFPSSLVWIIGCSVLLFFFLCIYFYAFLKMWDNLQRSEALSGALWFTPFIAAFWSFLGVLAIALVKPLFPVSYQTLWLAAVVGAVYGADYCLEVWKQKRPR